MFVSRSRPDGSLFENAFLEIHPISQKCTKTAQESEMTVHFETRVIEERPPDILRKRFGDQFQNMSRYKIDDLIYVYATSRIFRKKMSEDWDKRAFTSAVVTCVAGPAAILGGLGTISAAVARANPYITTALGVFTLGFSIFTGLYFYWMHQASNQKIGWNADPAENVAWEREKCYREGFRYVYETKSKLIDSSKNAALLPFEVESIFNRYFDKFCKENLLQSQRCSNNQDKKKWVDAFRNLNPVSKDALEYAYGKVPDQYGAISSDYEILATVLEDLQNEFEKLKGKRQSETTAIIKDVKECRKLALDPFGDALFSYRQKAGSLRDEKLAKLNANQEKEKKEAEKEYEDSVDEYILLYATATAPLKLYFDGKEKEANDNLDKVLKQIGKNEALATAGYFDDAQALLTQIKKVKENHYAYQQKPFTPEEVFNVPVPSAPSMGKTSGDFVKQAREQSVGEQVKQSDYEDFLTHVLALAEQSKK